MNVFSHFEKRFRDVAKTLQKEGILPAQWKKAALTIEPPRDPSHGDIASNAAMVLAKQAKKPPRDLAHRDRLTSQRSITPQTRCQFHVGQHACHQLCDWSR